MKEQEILESAQCGDRGPTRPTLTNTPRQFLAGMTNELDPRALSSLLAAFTTGVSACAALTRGEPVDRHRDRLRMVLSIIDRSTRRRRLKKHPP